MVSCPRQEWIAHTPREPNVRTSHVKFRRSDLRFRVNRIVLDRAPITSGLPRIADILRGGAVGMSQTCHEETSRVRVAQKKAARRRPSHRFSLLPIAVLPARRTR